MAYKPLSQIVAERLAQMKGESSPVETHHIATPRQHDIGRLLQKDEKPAEPPPRIDHSLLEQVRQRPHTEDHSAAIHESSRLLRESRQRSAPKPAKLSSSQIKQLRSKRPGIY